MTTHVKRKLKAFIIKTEMWWYGITALGFVFVIVALIWLAPTISNLTLAEVQLFTGFTATVAAAASAIKSNDTET